MPAIISVIAMRKSAEITSARRVSDTAHRERRPCGGGRLTVLPLDRTRTSKSGPVTTLRAAGSNRAARAPVLPPTRTQAIPPGQTPKRPPPRSNQHPDSPRFPSLRPGTPAILRKPLSENGTTPNVRLTVDTGPAAGTWIQLERDRQFLLGSAEDCALRIQEPGVLPQHAVVKALKDQGYGVKALGPGLRINGQATDVAVLQDGDVLELGTTKISFGSADQRRGPQITGYKILGELGRGGMGMVWRAEQVSLRREVALKVLSHKLTDDPQFVQKFVAEAHAAAKLSHPNVVQVFDVDHDGDTYYYSMELMHDGSLEGWLKKNGKMPVERALQVIADAALGLAYAESLDIVHRDIKPDNLMLDQHGNVKIADLGLARTEEGGEDKLAGTPHFMAPEQVLRKPVDHRTDLYALGCTFFRLVTGRTPFRGATSKDILRAQVKDEPEQAHRVEPSVPVEVSTIIGRLLRKDPAERFQSANDLREAVLTLLQPPAKKGLWIGLAAAAVLIALGAVYWAVTKPKEQTIVEKYRDNPEMLELATRNEQLQKDAREDKATIALLTARLSGATGLPLAEAIEQVAKTHAGCRAAGEATELSRRIRNDEQQRLAAEAQRKERLQQALTALRGELDAALAARQLRRALDLLSRPAPAELAGESGWTQGHSALRTMVEQSAAGKLSQLRAALATAKDQQDAVVKFLKSL